MSSFMSSLWWWSPVLTGVILQRSDHAHDTGSGHHGGNGIAWRVNGEPVYWQFATMLGRVGVEASGRGVSGRGREDVGRFGSARSDHRSARALASTAFRNGPLALRYPAMSSSNTRASALFKFPYALAICAWPRR